MKLFIINNARMPTEKAHGYQIAKMCESFSLRGIEIELLVPKRNNDIVENIFDYYKIQNNFKITYLDSFDFFKFERLLGSRLSHYMQSLVFLRKVKDVEIGEHDIVLTRNPEIAGVMADGGAKVYYDAHRWPESKNALFKQLLKKVTGFICNSRGTAKAFRDNGFTNCLVVPNGVDMEAYKFNKSKPELRRELGIFGNKKIIMYVGHLYGWKGIDLVFDLARKNKAEDWQFVFVGGTDKDIEKYKEQVMDEGLSNVSLLGHKKKNIIPKYQMSADVLLLPNIASTEESIRYTSPIKMFEYMTSRVPILASNLPSIKEILNDDNAFLFQTGDLQDMELNLKRAVDTKNTKNIIDQAFSDVKQYTWDKRAEKIINFIK